MQNADKQCRRLGLSVFFFSFLLPFLTLMLIYAEMGMAPFGDRSVLLMDMSEQNVNFFAELRNIVRGDSSIYFSWSKSFGSSFIGVFAYYLSSPFSILTVFFKPEDLPVALLFLTCLKIGLAGLSLAIYFRLSFQKAGIGTLIFSLCYALMSYSFAFSLSIMWLDGLIWLPMILLGIEKLLAGRLPWILTLSLGVMFVSNYYISYMIGLFSLLYFLYRLLSEKRRLRQCLRLFIDFTGAAVIAAGMAAWLLLPAGLDLMTGKLAHGPATADKGMYFMSVELYRRLLPGQYDGITYGLPYLFCGTTVLLLAITYFFNPRIVLRERIAAYIFVRVLILSFCSKQLNFIWHGFQYPNWFPFRNSFLFSFLLIFLAFRSVSVMPISDLKRRLIKNQKTLHRADAVLSLFMLLLLSLQTVELYQNGKTIIRGLDRDFNYLSINDYQEFYHELLPLVEQAESSPGFFRMEKNFERSKNDALLLGYKGVTHYSSAFNDQINRFTRQLGFSQGSIWNSYFGHTPLTDMLFNMEYMMSRTAMPTYYERVGENGSVALYANPSALPVAFMAKDISPLESNDFDAQNEILAKASGLAKPYFTPCEVTALAAERYSFTVKENAPHYLYIALAGHGYGDIYVNEVYRGHYSTNEAQCILYIGDYQKGETVIVNIENNQEPAVEEPAAVRISALDTGRLAEAFRILAIGGLRVSKSGAAYISGQVIAQHNGTMLTSIPYDAGFKVTVDGNNVTTAKAFDTFLSFPVPEGSHKIEIRYFARGQMAGILISIGSTVMFAWLLIRHRMNSTKCLLPRPIYAHIFSRFRIF